MPAQLITDFDIWQPGYNASTVDIYIAGTTTLAAVFFDEALSLAADNPQILQSRTDDAGNDYGKFVRSLYTAVPYFLKIDHGEDTGIKRPALNTLIGADASQALVTVANSSRANTLADIVGRVVHAENYGEMIAGGSSGSAATNTTTIEAAIGALGTGGIVVLPAGLYRINAISLPAGVILEGQGESATTLQLINNSVGVLITGDKSGFRNMTLDGSILTTASVGVYSVNHLFPIFTNFTVKNFETGVYCKGGNNPQWLNFSILNCVNGAKIYGDRDAGNTNAGGSFVGGFWKGGTVFACSTVGVDLKYIDATIAHTAFENVYFNSNPGIAARLKGAQFMPFDNCRWVGNVTNVDMSDDATVLTPLTQYQNRVFGIRFTGGVMSGGTVKVTGNADDVIFEHMKLLGVTFNLVAPLAHNIILKDCFEDGATVLTGSSSQLVRQFGREEFEVTGLTTGNAATRAWGVTLDPNQLAYFEVKAIGVQRNGVNKAIYHAVVGGSRAPSTLLYASQTVNFTVGDIVTGANSLATARVVADSDSGATGTLSLEDVQGTFANGEIITGSTTGSATVNGSIADGTHSVDGIGLVHLRTEYETDAAWDISFAFSAGEIAFQVQGNSSQTVDWTANIKMVTS